MRWSEMPKFVLRVASGFRCLLWIVAIVPYPLTANASPGAPDALLAASSDFAEPMRHQALADIERDAMRDGFRDAWASREDGELTNAPSQQAASPETTVAIPDSALRTVIATTLGKSADEAITQGDLASLAKLDARELGIVDLTGLEFAINLQWLDLLDNRVQDISPLSGLSRLLHLRISRNPASDDLSPLAGNVALVTLHAGSRGLSDITPLANLLSLKELWITSSSVSDISVLARLTALEELVMADNNVSDISPLAGLTSLQILDLPGNPIADFSPFAKLTALKRLQLGETGITDISFLAGLTALRVLDLHINDISSVEPLRSLTALEDLSLYRNSISDISALAPLTSLRELSLGVNAIEDIASLRSMTRLERLSLGGNAIADVSPLARLTRLKRLGLNDNPISDISALSSLTAMETLRLPSYGVTDISVLSGMANLQALHANNNAISDISPLSSLTSLKTLYIDRNPIEDISALANLVALEDLVLVENPIQTVSPLADLTALKSLMLGGNNITDISDLAGLTALNSLWLSGNNITDISDLAGLTGLRYLALRNNALCDISALAGLTSLVIVPLEGNAIQNIGPLVENIGLGAGDQVNLNNNPLDAESIRTHIPALRARGVSVTFNRDSAASHGSGCGGQPPVAIGEIDMLSLTAGSIAEVDLADRFHAPNEQPLAYVAQSSQENVARVSISGDATLHVVANAPGRAEVEVTATATHSDSTSAQLSFAVVVSPSSSMPVPFEVEGTPLALDLARLLPHMEVETAVVSESSNADVVAAHIRNQELILVPGEDEGSAEIVITAMHKNGWRETRRFPVIVEPTFYRSFHDWQLILLQNATNAENDTIRN